MATGIRKLIYVKSQEVWDEIEAAAERIDRSVSWYLIDCHRHVSEFRREEHLDEIPSEPDVVEQLTTEPEVEKPVPKNPKKKAALAKIKEPGFFKPNPKLKDSKGKGE